MSKYSKAWAAGIAQAVVQLVASFVPFEPELEQALGVMITAAIVWLVPNGTNVDRGDYPPAASVGTAVTMRAPFWSMAAALGLAAMVAGCVGLNDRTADSLLGEDCGPEGRVHRAQLLTERLHAHYPAVATPQLDQALAQMEAALAEGRDLAPAALAYQAALGSTFGPIAGVSADQPVLLTLSQLPGMAQELLIIRARLASFCATTPGSAVASV